MHKPQFRIVKASGLPAQHPAAVAVDAVPHDLANKPPDPPEACHAVQLALPAGEIVLVAFGNQPAADANPGLAAGGAQGWVGLKFLEQALEISGAELEVAVEL